jgi:hypothetical protein
MMAACVGAITVEAGEDVGAGSVALNSNLIFPALAFLQSRSFRHGLRANHVKSDCFVWFTDLDCGKASPLLRSSLDLGRIPAAP